MALMAILGTKTMAQDAAVHFDMSLKDGRITETESNTDYQVMSQLPAFTVAGIDGEALRFDGYSNYVKAKIPTSTLNTEALTLSVVLAAETYPMMQVDVAETTPTYGTICGNLSGKTGFALQLSSQGDLRFQFGSAYSGGFLFTIDGSKKLPRGQWCTVTAVLDKAANSAKLYLDGEEIGSSRMSRSDIAHSTADFCIGKDDADVKSGPFLINTFCGLIDDISIYSLPLTPSQGGGTAAPDFSYPLSRYTDVAPSGAWHPLFHGMPSGSWTNETHGMTFSDGRYHLFFQKNANGPYMSRLHWGHISSENLCDWREEPIAIAPGEAYDLKGCWSGCVYADGDDTYILYTAVDNARATIAQAKATDAGLTTWEKQGIVVNGTPAGGFQDFRDPYYFEADGRKYLIVGTGKNGVGCCTLHRYENGAWTNDGTVFFQGSTANLHGTFWEMPNVTPMGDGRWLFTCTPLGTGVGVRTLCWVGTIGADGKFVPDANGVQYLEMGGISRDGYGLLSPTILPTSPSPLTSSPSPLTSHLLIGIVPDKLPTQQNFEMGWAHNYSLPRELSLAADGTLIQKPFSGLDALRTTTTFSMQKALLGVESLNPVNGRQMELLGQFTVASGTCGFNILKSGDRQASLTYDTDKGTLTLDMTTLDRTPNDRGVYDGVYSATLPRKVNAGEKLTLHLWIDGSIADIFVNDTWAFSVRLFPNDAAQTEAEVFATTEMQADVKAWVLDAHNGVGTGIRPIGSASPEDNGLSLPGTVFDLQGRSVCQPAKGIYIKNGRKYAGR